MLEKLFWFGGGYLVARYLILRDGVEAYKDKEAELINTVKEKTNTIAGNNLVDMTEDQEFGYYVQDYEGPYQTY